MTVLIENSSFPEIRTGQSVLFVEKEPAAKTVLNIPPRSVVTHYRLNENRGNALSVEIGEGATYNLITVKLGTGEADISVALNGRGASCVSDVVYAVNGDQQAVIRSDIRHNASDTVSRQLVKGAAAGRGKVAFEGGIYIPYDLETIDGAQQHRALLLSKEAEIKAVPKLEIYSDDVKCAHGSAIGSLDREQMFYMRTRGIDENEARRILTIAFMDEVLDRMNLEELKDELKSKVESWIK